MVTISDLILTSLKRFPRLFARFHLPTSPDLRPYDEVIENDDEFDHLKHMILDEIIYNQQQITEYVEVWAPFRAIWETDKVEFSERFVSTTASTFDMNITIYTETANQVQLQESITSVYFLDVSAYKLKNSILLHIEEWKDRYKDLLKKTAFEKLTSNCCKPLARPNLIIFTSHSNLRVYQVVSPTNTDHTNNYPANAGCHSIVRSSYRRAADQSQRISRR